MQFVDERLDKTVVELQNDDNESYETIDYSYKKIHSMFKECKSIRNELRFMKEKIMNRLDDIDENTFSNFSKSILKNKQTQLESQAALMSICAEILNNGSMDDVSLLRLQRLLENTINAMSKKMFEEKSEPSPDHELEVISQKVKSLELMVANIKEILKDVRNKINDCLYNSSNQ